MYVCLFVATVGFITAQSKRQPILAAIAAKTRKN
jgi:hypothetical protein